MGNKKTVVEEHSIIGNINSNENKFVKTTDSGTNWFFEKTNLGLFIHFGISTVHGDLDISWGMMDNPERRKKGNGIVTPREYWSLARQFNPQKYNPIDWLSAAKENGFSYAVLTTRHHDGYALWPSNAGDFSTKQFLSGRDLVSEYVDACRKVGLKVGLYYSPPDWRFNQEYMSFMVGSHSTNYPDRPYEDIDHKPIDAIKEMPKEHYDKYIEYLNTQIRELLTNYGQIDLLWFDGSVVDKTNLITIDEIRKLQPHIIVNDRLWGWGIGDYTSKYECHLPNEKPDQKWETCQIWHVGGGWSYVKNADKYRALDITLNQYDTCLKWGGNLLLNIAPDSDGVVPCAYYESVKELNNAIKAKY